MTETSQDAEDLKNIKEYVENERLIGRLTSKLDRIAESIPTFLKNPDHEGASETLLTTEESMATISREYERAVHKRRSLQDCLRQTGYGILVDK